MFKKIFTLKFRTLLIFAIVTTVINFAGAVLEASSHLSNYVMGLMNGANWALLLVIYWARKEGLDD